MRKLDLVNKRFGKLVVLNETKRRKNYLLRLCLCDCGQKKWITTSSLISGNTKSCGCWGGKLEFGLAARNQVLFHYKFNAKRRNLLWKLTSVQFDILTAGQCFFCGRSARKVFKSRGNNGEFVYNGIDRLDNNKGYIFKNCVSCCEICNKAKNNLPLSDFLAWIQDLTKYIYAKKSN